MKEYSPILLSAEHREQALNLFVECFFDNHLYIDLFPNESIRKDKLYHAVEINIDYIIDEHKSYCIVDNGKLISFIFNIDYHKLAENPKQLIKMFVGDENAIENPYEDTLVAPMSTLPSALYMLSCAVHPSYRRQGISNLLLNKTIDTFKHMYIVADVANPYLINTFYQKEFDITVIEKDHWFCVLPPNRKRG